MSWISVKDRLPNHDEIVAVYTARSSQCVTVFIKGKDVTKSFKDHGINLEDKNDCFCSIEIKGNVLNKVTHWRNIEKNDGERWISIERQLPKHEQWVYCMNKSNDKFVSTFVDKKIVYDDLISKNLPCHESWKQGYDFYSHQQEKHKIFNITHWMSLYEPPEDK